MHTRRSGAGRDIGRVNDKVSHLAVEDIDRHPVQVRGPVGVAVDQAKAREAGRGLEHRPRGRVSIKLGEVVGNNRGRDDVGSRWEVDDGRSFGARSLLG